MIERPAYRTLDIAPGLRFFDCAPLMAVLSTQACGQRWATAALGATCHECQLGRLHHANLHPGQAQRRLPASRSGQCARCGRADLRLIVSTTLCVSCAAREAEWRKGRNAKSKPPATYRPLHSATVAIQHSDGSVECRYLEVADAAESLACVARALPAGSKFIDTPRPGPVVWNPAVGEFEYQCSECSEVGLVLERIRDSGILEYHCWAHQGDPHGAGWRLAKVGRPILKMGVDAMAAVLNGDPELNGEAPCSWTPTVHPCICGAGQIEAQLLAAGLAAGGRWSTRCLACGSVGEA